ncbi:MAG: hypothetical protein A2268_03770 [Candidatus Raymondbacteria bacterium RifOxyA12_full_50_37]|uniref:Phosphate transport regulator n=1 Tax=Candidatus Raymondbacteria bacterium RIFOXYD12_FULL_49_13 TaxID=1817890 RepID=A0A1F7F4Y9_UNCRA|nr:MAG: hypothetical protein A2350_03540 [Candidatus Raymondbacteria bacterium RifOxyB12_full_50_8]OGJ90561.1 MAG: hypothetical protein A2268_03770 [Candidatus Raymondbacteria bacterium RifOxyA12_full_50_37]OGJ91910.1 MAG: hypothetical protein A2248_04840 [Candidatus Raymondbacteria bacterium RIFOXYA2_FULL_49_16]OGJ96024.1 MAG: hypothetical protein A2487_01670 [Candidatus Raymondbacteria bacterium RifOxyC12_full_50_8]OGJ98052.1 MAG: hypothetical protein A2453_12180 [Candidatus Raymondbacteria b
MKLKLLDLLLPRETKFFTYMHDQVDILIEGCHVFKDLVAILGTKNENEIKTKLAKIKDCEIRGDAVEKGIIDELHKTFITPIDREDIHSMAVNIDRSLDILNSISQKFEIYHIDSVPFNVGEFGNLLLEIALELRNLIDALKEKSNVQAVVEKIHGLENRGDYLFHLSMAELFSGSHPPIDIIKFKEVYEHLEEVVDSVDFVAKMVRGIMVKLG